MAEYPTYTVTDVSRFTGRAEDEYTDYIDQALEQAVLLFKIGTCLAGFPDDLIDESLAKNGILSMADAIFLVQPFQATLATPFSSETIGSYSYSKLQGAVSAGLPTGISWFDLAVGRLSVCDDVDGVPFSGGINVHEEYKNPHGGYGAYLGPAEINGDFDGRSFDPPEVV